MFKKGLIIIVMFAFAVGCSSGQIKARKEQRDKASQSSKIYCDFVNGELYPDVEVMLNLEMSKRCDSEKSFSISQYKTSNENNGVLYCCSIIEKVDAALKTEKKPVIPTTDNKTTPKGNELEE